MLSFYTVVVSEVVILMVFLMFWANVDNLLSSKKRNQFLLLFSSVVLSILAEWSGSVAAHLGGSFRHVHVWAKMVELSLTPFVPYVCAEVLTRPGDVLPKRKWFQGILLLHTGLEILSAFSGFIFYVDESGVFCHGPYYWIHLVTYLGMSACVLWVGYRVNRQYQNENKAILIPMLGFLLFGIAANQADKTIKSAWLTVALVVTLTFIFYIDMLRRIDGTTRLLNHASYDQHLSRLRKAATIQKFDIDSFKSVNDTQGRSYADHCLRAIGGMILNVYGKYGKCYRTGADEFFVILDADEGFTDSLNKQFDEAMEADRKADPSLPHVSLGYSRYEPSGGSVQDAEQAANAAMYRNKARNKIKNAPIPSPARPASDVPPAPAPAEHQQMTQLDTTGLTDRTFLAFSSTAVRNYIYLCNMETGVSRWSRGAVEYFGLPGEYMFDASEIWEACIHPQDRQMYHDNISDVFAGRTKVHDLEYRVKNRLGKYVVCNCRGIVLKGADGEPDLFAGTIINHGIVDDVDPITNLHTNTEFTKSIRRLIDERATVCIIKVGIEHFRHLNAMYGQEGGNQILRLFGIELQELVEGKGSVFRLDGAKFAFYLNDIHQDEAREFFRRLCDVAENNIQINNLRIPLRIYGGAVLLDSDHSYNEYIVRSSLIYAMEQSQENYRGELVFAQDIHQEINAENIQLHKDIHRSAIEGCQDFFVCYQPIVSFKTGKVIGAEALLRWKRDPYGVVPPDNFIPWLETDPAFIPVGNWILRQAIQETEPLRRADPNFILNVNITDTQLEYSGFREDVLNILADTGCPPQNLCLELTERCRHMDIAFLSDELRFFRSHGITIAIDDFGTGSSSMTLLLQLPIDELKVDRFFLSKIFTNQNYRYLMESIMSSAKNMGFRTCVEGIETQEQYDLITSLGGDCYQGYYASKPLPIDGFLAFCRKE